MEKIGALITGGDFQALGALRTLAKKDIPVILIDNNHSIGRFSKFKKKFFRSPDPLEEEAFLNFLFNLVKREKIHGWVIIPNCDTTVHLLSKHKENLEKMYKIPFPSWDVIKNVYIKKNTYQFAEENGVPIPKTYYPENLQELLELDIRFPVVIKPSIKDKFYSKIKIKAFYINNEEELIKTYQRVSAVIDPSEILIQDFIPGGAHQLYSFCPLFKNGKIITAISARRYRQHPMDFGHATTFAELVDIPEIKDISEKFLRLINYYGIAEVEFMKDPRNGKYKLIEVNPRIWGWHTLAIAAGVDFPYLLYKDSIGDNIEAPSVLKHMKWIRLITDIPTAFLEIVKGNMELSSYIASMKGRKEYAVFCPDDPLPFFAEIAMIPYLWKKKGF